jgi:hypothetical protein
VYVCWRQAGWDQFQLLLVDSASRFTSASERSENGSAKDSSGHSLVRLKEVPSMYIKEMRVLRKIVRLLARKGWDQFPAW